MRLRKIFVAAASMLLLWSTPSFAVHSPDNGVTNEVPTHFILELNDGGKVTFLLDHNPRVVNGDEYILVCDLDDVIEYPLDNVYRYRMGQDDITGVEEIQNVTEGSIRPHAGMILISGFEAGAGVIVSDLGGSVLFNGSTGNDGNLTIDLSGYPEGIYIIKAQNQTFKFIKR